MGGVNKNVLLLTILMFGAAVAMPAIGGDAMNGNYSGQFNGQPAQASLSVQNNAVNGTLDVGGYVYRIDAQQMGNVVQGQMQDQQGMAAPLSMQLEGDQLLVRAYIQGLIAPPVEIALTRGTGQALGGHRPVAPTPNVQLDPRLIGHWTRSESYTSGDFSAVSETSVTLYPDGSYSYGPGRVIGGGNAGSFDSGGGGGGPAGRWRTENGILYTMEGGIGWAPYAKYSVEANKLLLTFGDGSRQRWNQP